MQSSSGNTAKAGSSFNLRNCSLWFVYIHSRPTLLRGMGQRKN
jgi:hypothetical protein